jgi:phospholipase/lecithinase/hemolysin
MKRNALELIDGLKSRFGILLSLTCLLAVQIPTNADPVPFSRIVVFGDSLSDTGNFYRLTGGRVPPAPYSNGRFSNGPLWVEYLAGDLGMQVLAGDDFAVAGATTGHDNSNDGLLGLEYPGLQDEIAQFLSLHPVGGADPQALYVLWAGANDFFVALESGSNPAALVANGVNNTVQALQALVAAGARNILVVNIPDLGVTPFGLSSGVSSSITRLCAAYNQTLEATLELLDDAGIPTIRVDAFTTLDAMVDASAQFGFTDVTDSFLAIGGDPGQFLFWDPVHPTTRGHEILADAARNQLIDYFSPRHGNRTPPAAVNSLNGLLHAGQGGH